MGEVTLSQNEAYELIKTCLLNNGCDEANAQAVTDTIIQAEVDQCFSHGIFRVPLYVKGLSVGRANGKAEPSVKQLSPSVIRVDGDSGFAPLGLQVAHQPLVECAKKNGIAALAFNNMFHIAAIWPEVEKLAEEGLCAMAFTSTYPYVAPAGGIKPVYGSNPIAFGWPRLDQSPLVFDQASAATARGEIMIAARDGHQVAENVGIGPNGEATTDPNVILEGAQLPFGGYKGASLAMMIELLVGPLIGDFLGIESKEDDAGKGGSPKGGELILAIDPAKFGDPEAIKAHGEKLFAAILEQDGTRLPGQRRLKGRANTAESGISIPQSLYDSILEMSQ